MHDRLALTNLAPSLPPPPELPTAPRLTALAIPLLGSLSQTFGIVWLLCRTPWPAAITWLTLLRTALFFLLSAFAAHLAAIRINRRLVRDRVDVSAQLLTLLTWPAVVWIPLLVLLTREASVWTAAVPLLIAATVVLLLKRWLAGTSTAPAVPSPISTLFHPQRPSSLPRTLSPALFTSLTLQGALTELLRSHFFTAGLLLAATAIFPIWTYTTPKPAPNPSLRTVAPRTLAVFLLLCLALLPYHQPSRFAHPAAALLRIHPGRRSTPTTTAISHPPSFAYSGVILTLPPKPRHEIVPPVPPTFAHPGVPDHHSVIIPFDGQYWYFREPDTRPKEDAPIVRADPTKRTIRSTDTRALIMEAHQRLTDPLPLSCCRTLRVTLRNAETSPSPITIEVFLSDSTPRPPITLRPAQPNLISLGSRTVASSQQFHPDPSPDESLNFSLPVHTQGRHFDQITVSIRRNAQRSGTGAHVSIQSFELIP